MLFDTIIQSSLKYFPDLKIKYKDESTFMKLIGKLLFFNNNFMTAYTTTIGSTIYFPSKTSVQIRPISSITTLLHELIHVHDAKKISSLLFSFLYLSPQILVLFLIPLLFLNWKIVLPFFLLAAPIPSFFRMYYEKRAYISSLYVIHHIGQKMQFDPMLDKQKESFIDQFTGPSYYFMWVFRDHLNKDFNEAIIKIKNNERPFKDPIFDMLDDLLKNL